MKLPRAVIRTAWDGGVMQWVITVGIDPYTEQAAADVRDLASPELIKVVHEPRHAHY